MYRSLIGITLAGTLVAALLWMSHTAEIRAQEDAKSPDQFAQTDTLTQLQQRLDSTIRERGVARAVPTQTVTSPANSTILELVPEGRPVKEGDTLVVLDSSLHKAQLRKLEIELHTATSQAELAKRTVKRLQEQFELAQAVSESRMRTAELKREAFQAKSKTADLTDAEQRAIEAELQLGTLEARLSGLQLVSTLDQQLTQHRSELAAAEAKIRQTADQVSRVQNMIAASQIRAEAEGIVTYATQASRRTATSVIEEGAEVRERQTILQVFKPEEVEVVVSVHESRIARLKTGQPVKIQFDAYPDHIFQGAVAAISKVAAPAPWPNTDLKEFEVIVRLAGPPESRQGLRTGLTALAEIDVTD